MAGVNNCPYCQDNTKSGCVVSLIDSNKVLWKRDAMMVLFICKSMFSADLSRLPYGTSCQDIGLSLGNLHIN